MSDWVCGCGADRILLDFRGRPFRGCSRYPECKDTARGTPWDRAISVYAKRAPRLANGRVVAGLDYGYTVCKILRAAESRLVIVTFSIGDDGMVDALVNDAIDRGVDVEVWAGGVARKQGQRLSDLGARVWLPKPGTNLHAKFIVADGLVAVVGSANLAQTSLTRNLEVGVISTKDVSMWAGQWRRDAVRRFRVL